MALLTAEALTEPALDLERLMRRWAEWKAREGAGLDPWTAEALDHFATHGTPPAMTGGRAPAAALVPTIPVALATAGTPRNLVSGTWHIAALLYPEPHCTWGAVAVNVALARFLHGRRDFIPDVLEALKANEAPGALVEAVRRVPLEKSGVSQESGVGSRGSGGVLPVVLAVETALWYAYHEPKLDRGLERLAGEDPATAAAAAALMGARDGEGKIPARWLAGVPEVDRIRGLADRLGQPLAQSGPQ